ncbi:MAG: TonB-dependent receptor [Ignavibacteria bacterium]|jgi:TonB-dependent receptor
MKIKLLILCLFITSSITFAAAGRISGKVTDEDNFSLAAANVYVQSINKGAATNPNGEFTINLDKGTYQVVVSYLGYQPKTIEVNVEENKTTFINVELESGIVLGDEVLVLGDQLKGQAKALNQQKENANITNIVSADQIGRFPDQNIGDALKRITSITVNYDQGEARFGNIRGTEPRLNSVMINGERIPSAEAEIRNVQLDLVPSDMIQTIEVNKAVTPDMDADAIGGAINLVTKSAPNDLRISGTVGTVYNALSEKMAPIGSFTVGQRFFENKLGVVVNGSYYDHEMGSDNTEGSWDGDQGDYYPEEWQIRKYEIRRLRQSIGATLDFKLAPFHTIYARGIYNHRNDWENRFRAVYEMDEIEVNDEDVDGWVVARQTKGGIDNDDNEGARLEDQRMWTTSLSGDHLFDSGVKLNWSIAASKASEERPNERYIEWEAEVVEDDVQIDLADTREPTIIESIPLSSFELHEITEEYQYTEEKDFNAKIDLEIPLMKNGQYKNSLKFGARYRGKDKERDNNFFEYEPLSGFDNLLSVGNQDYTDNDFLAGDYKVGRQTDAGTLGSFDLQNSTLFEKEDKVDEYAADNFTAEENITAGYIQLNQQLGDKLFMIAGVRYEKTDIDYNGNEFNEDTEEVTPTFGSDDYTNIMPGLHFKYNVNNNTILRLAWTNTIARPSYYDLVPFRNIKEDNEELEVGNPALEPTTSMNFDLMGESYFKSVGIVSAGVFYKKIDDFIYVYSEDDYLDPVSGNTYDEFFQPRNGAEATLFGLEVAFQRRLDFLKGIFKNINIYTNYTYTNSSADNPVLDAQVEGDEDIELPGSAPHIFNANLTYQDEKIVLGVSFNYSSAYIDPDELDLTPGLERYYDDVTRLDINGSYAFTPNLRFFFEANNLTNQPLRYYAGDKDRTYQAEYYNVTFNAGIKFDF